MAKRKKKAAPAPAKPQPPGPFHAPFAGLGQALKQAAPPAPPAPPAQPSPPPAEPEPDDQALFARAMDDVRPLAGCPRQPLEPQGPGPFLDAAPDEDLEVLAQLADLVSGAAEFDLRMSDEYVSGALDGVGPELMERLARGEFPVQDYLDLHGLSQDEAFAAVEGFLQRSQIKGLRHVLIVHGRGFRSPLGVPVIKTALAAWLRHKRLGKRVLAFCTALARDGGAGASYVLLRRWRGPGQARW